MLYQSTSTEQRAPLSAHYPAAFSNSNLLALLDEQPLGKHLNRLKNLLGLNLFWVAFNTLIVSFTISSTAKTFDFNPDKNGFTAGLLINLGFLAQGIGALLLGWLSEHIGRKKATAIALSFSGVGGVFVGLATTLPLLIGWRIVQCIGLGAMLPLAITWFNELVPSGERRKQGIILAAWYAWGNFLMPLIAGRALALLGDELSWRMLLVVGALVPLISSLVCFFLLPESIRWLIDKGSRTEAISVMKNLDIAIPQEESEHHSTQQAALTGQAQTFSFRELFSPSFWRSTLVTWSQWFVAYFLITSFSNGLPLWFANFNLRKQSLLLTIVYGVGVLIVVYLLVWATRKGDFKHPYGMHIWLKTCYVFELGAAILGCLIWYLFPQQNILLFSIMLLLSLSAFIIFSCLYVHSGELFPTRIRSFALSTGRAWQSAATIIAPITTFYLHSLFGLQSVLLLWLTVSLIGLISLISFPHQIHSGSLERVE